MDLVTQPLVSVGVPTYNRPRGLQRTLCQIAAQTYRTLEIIVSDNASEGNETERVVRDMMAKDDRIHFYRQSTNLGPHGNFQFVFSKAKGEYFLWAADDDEWHPDFITKCLEAIGDNGSAMTHRATRYRVSGLDIPERAPNLLPAKSPGSNAIAYLHCFDSCLIYGIHRTETMKLFLTEDGFDFFDFFFVLRQIINHGYVIAPHICYFSGIDSEVYQTKVAESNRGKHLQYTSFLLASSQLILTSPKLLPIEKLRLMHNLICTALGMFCRHESETRPFQATLARTLRRILRLAGRLGPVSRRISHMEEDSMRKAKP